MGTVRHKPYAIFGIRQPSLDTITLSDAERRALARAAAILGDVRELRNSVVPTDWYAAEEDDSDLLFGWRICDELARTGTIDAETVSDG